MGPEWHVKKAGVFRQLQESASLSLCLTRFGGWLFKNKRILGQIASFVSGFLGENWRNSSLNLTFIYGTARPFAQLVGIHIYIYTYTHAISLSDRVAANILLVLSACALQHKPFAQFQRDMKIFRWDTKKQKMHSARVRFLFAIFTLSQGKINKMTYMLAVAQSNYIYTYTHTSWRVCPLSTYTPTPS